MGIFFWAFLVGFRWSTGRLIVTMALSVDMAEH